MYIPIAVGCDKPWVKFSEQNIPKKERIREGKIKTKVMAWTGHNEDVHVGILVKPCDTLGFMIDDITDIIQNH